MERRGNYSRSNRFGGNRSGKGSGSNYRPQGQGTVRTTVIYRNQEADDLTKRRIKETSNSLFKSALHLVRLPGGYPVCYAAGGGRGFVTSYTAWNKFKEVCYEEAKSRVAVENGTDDKVGAPFTWGFRQGFPITRDAYSAEVFSFLVMFIQTNILPFEIPRDKFINSLNARVPEDRIEELEHLVDVLNGKENTFAEKDDIVLLIDCLEYESAQAPNMTPGELSEFFRNFPAGNAHTSNLKLDALPADIIELRAARAQETAANYQMIASPVPETRENVLNPPVANPLTPARRVTVADNDDNVPVNFISDTEVEDSVENEDIIPPVDDREYIA